MEMGDREDLGCEERHLYARVFGLMQLFYTNLSTYAPSTASFDRIGHLHVQTSRREDIHTHFQEKGKYVHRHQAMAANFE